MFDPRGRLHCVPAVSGGVQEQAGLLTLQVCYAFFLMLGTVGYRASLMFVRHIYRCGARLMSAYNLQSQPLLS